MKKKLLLNVTTVMVFSLFLLVGCTQSTDIPNAPTPAPEPTATAIPTAIPTATPTPSPAEIPHVHEYIGNVSVSADCETDGETLFSCPCGDSYAEPITATGHNYGEYVYNNDATQKADGTKTRTCSTCDKKDTKTAEGTKLPFDPYSLRAITSLDEIESIGTMTDEDDSLHYQVRLNIEAGVYEKVRYISSTGEQFCIWDVRLTDTRNGNLYYYWFAAPVNDKFSNGYMHSNLIGRETSDIDESLTLLGPRISGSYSECMIDRDESIPLGERAINSTECPVNLYEIVETDDMISVWVESTNCGQEGIGTCGSFDCTGTCLRSTTLNTFQGLPRQKGWRKTYGGENGRIYWNGKLLVNFYSLKAD